MTDSPDSKCDCPGLATSPLLPGLVECYIINATYHGTPLLFSSNSEALSIVTDELLLIQKLLASIIIGYLLGSIPFAHLVARRKGIDIFATGSTRAGTANIFWNISRRNGLMVFTGDIAKGWLAVLFAKLLGVPDEALILAGGAAVAGHWKSIFTRFRGGDGMVTLLGVTLYLVPWLTFLGVAVGVGTLILTRRYHFRSSLGITVCYTVLIMVSQFLPYFHKDRLEVRELSVLALLVIFHNVFIHRRHAPLLSAAPEDLVDADDLDLDFDPDFPDNL